MLEKLAKQKLTSGVNNLMSKRITKEESSQLTEIFANNQILDDEDLATLVSKSIKGVSIKKAINYVPKLRKAIIGGETNLPVDIKLHLVKYLPKKEDSSKELRDTKNRLIMCNNRRSELLRLVEEITKAVTAANEEAKKQISEEKKEK